MADAMTSAILYRVCVHTPEWAVQSSPRSNVRSGIAAAAASSPKEGTNSKSSVWCCSRRRRQPSPPVASEDTPSSSDAAWQLAADPNRKRVLVLKGDSAEVRTARNHYTLPLASFSVPPVSPARGRRPVCWSPCGRLVAVAWAGDDASTACVFRVASKAPPYKKISHGQDIVAMCFLPCSRSDKRPDKRPNTKSSGAADVERRIEGKRTQNKQINDKNQAILILGKGGLLRRVWLKGDQADQFYLPSPGTCVAMAAIDRKDKIELVVAQVTADAGPRLSIWTTRRTSPEKINPLESLVCASFWQKNRSSSGEGTRRRQDTPRQSTWKMAQNALWLASGAGLLWPRPPRPQGHSHRNPASTPGTIRLSPDKSHTIVAWGGSGQGDSCWTVFSLIPRLKVVATHEGVADADWWSSELLIKAAPDGSVRVSPLAKPEQDLLSADGGRSAPLAFEKMPRVCARMQALAAPGRGQAKHACLVLDARKSRRALHSLSEMTAKQFISAAVRAGRLDDAEAVCRARSMPLDAVLVARWAQANPITIDSVERILAQVSDRWWAIMQAATCTGGSVGATQALLSHGLVRTAQGLRDCGWDTKRPIGPPEAALLALRAHFGSALQRLSACCDGEDDDGVALDRFRSIRWKNLNEAAVWLASAADPRGLAALARACPLRLRGRALCAALDNLPETVHPSRYKDLLSPSSLCGALGAKRGDGGGNDNDDGDKWGSDNPVVLRAAAKVLQAASTNPPYVKRLAMRALSSADKSEPAAWMRPGELREWFEARIISTDETTGLLGHAAALCGLAVDALASVDETCSARLMTLQRDVAELYLIVYRHDCDLKTHIQQYRKLARLGRLALAMRDVAPKKAVRCLERGAGAVVLLGETTGRAPAQLLRSFLEHKWRRGDVETVAFVLEHCLSGDESGKLLSRDQAVEVALACAYVPMANSLSSLSSSSSSSSSSQTALWLRATQKLTRALSPEPDNPPTASIARLLRHVNGAVVLARYGAADADILSWYLRCEQPKRAANAVLEARGLVERMARRCVQLCAAEKWGQEQWERLRNDIEILSHTTPVFLQLPRTFFDVQFARAQLLSGAFVRARRTLAALTAKRSANDTAKLDLDVAKRLVLSVAREFFASASSVEHESFRGAVSCLEILPLGGDANNSFASLRKSLSRLINQQHTNARALLSHLKQQGYAAADESSVDVELEMERWLVEAVRRLSRFDNTVVPLQVRQSLAKDRLAHVRRALGFKNAYRDTTELLEIATLLGAFSRQDQCRVRLMAAAAALRSRDFHTAKGAVLDLIQSSGYQPAWRMCLRLADSVIPPRPKSPSALAKLAESNTTVRLATNLFTTVGQTLQATLARGKAADGKNTAADAPSLSRLSDEELLLGHCFAFCEGSELDTVLERWRARRRNAAATRAPMDIERTVLRGEDPGCCTRVRTLTDRELAAEAADAPDQGMAYLLSLDDPLSFDRVLQSGKAVTTTQAEMALRLYAMHATGSQEPLDAPAKALARTWRQFKTADKSANESANESANKSANESSTRDNFATVAKRYAEVWLASCKADEALSLDSSLDPVRIRRDPAYAREAALRLCRRSSSKGLTAALALASAQPYECAVEWIHWQLINQERLRDEWDDAAEAIRALQSNPPRAYAALRERTLPCIPGHSLQALKILFRIIQSAVSRAGEDGQSAHAAASEHRYLLERLLRAHVRVDYARLVNSATFRSELRLAVGTDNVFILARLARHAAGSLSRCGGWAADKKARGPAMPRWGASASGSVVSDNKAGTVGLSASAVHAAFFENLMGEARAAWRQASCAQKWIETEGADAAARIYAAVDWIEVALGPYAGGAQPPHTETHAEVSAAVVSLALERAASAAGPVGARREAKARERLRFFQTLALLLRACRQQGAEAAAESLRGAESMDGLHAAAARAVGRAGERARALAVALAAAHGTWTAEGLAQSGVYAVLQRADSPDERTRAVRAAADAGAASAAAATRLMQFVRDAEPERQRGTALLLLETVRARYDASPSEGAPQTHWASTRQERWRVETELVTLRAVASHAQLAQSAHQALRSSREGEALQQVFAQILKVGWPRNANASRCDAATRVALRLLGEWARLALERRGAEPCPATVAHAFEDLARLAIDSEGATPIAAADWVKRDPQLALVLQQTDAAERVATRMNGADELVLWAGSPEARVRVVKRVYSAAAKPSPALCAALLSDGGGIGFMLRVAAETGTADAEQVIEAVLATFAASRGEGAFVRARLARVVDKLVAAKRHVRAQALLLNWAGTHPLFRAEARGALR